MKFLKILKKFYFYFLIFLSVAFISSCTKLEKSKKIDLIYDNDVDFDDLMTILFLLKSKNINLKAITCVGTGITHQNYGVKNVLNLLEFANHPKIPVSYGETESLNPHIAFPHHWAISVNNLLGIKLPKNQNPPSPLSSVDLMIKIIKKSSRKTTILVTGPLTNLAVAITKDPSIIKNIERVFIMGGNIHSGDHLSSEQADYNFNIDSKAVKTVFDSNLPITLIPKETTHFAPINMHILNNKKYAPKTKECQFVMKLSKEFLKDQPNDDLYFWDAVPASIIVNPKIATAYLHLPTKIMLNKYGHYVGMKIEDNNPICSVCYKINSELFYNTFFNTLNKEE